MNYKHELTDSSTWPKNFVGIYAIYSKKSNKIYIGKTNHKKGFFGRWEDHRELLRINKHDNPYLQHSYNKNGENDFYLKIIEICERNDPNLQTKEWTWIEKLEAMYFQKGWNIDSHERYEKRSSKYRPKSKRLSKFEFINPNGEIIMGQNLKKFARENGLCDGNLNKVLHGKLHSHKGYKSTNPDFHRKYNEYKLISPDNKEYIFNNIMKFSKENNLKFSNVSAILLSKKAHTKGWRLQNPKVEFIPIINNYLKYYYVFSESKQVIFKFKSVRKFHLQYFNKEPLRNFYSFLDKVKTSFKDLILLEERDIKTHNIVEI